ncbi:glycoside hydrolase domain-containing protein [Microbacterium sp. NPDC055455]
MPTYSNGYIPENLLVTFATGWNRTDGDWKHQLSPGTYAKYRALVARSPGGKLQVTPGWGAYRPYYAQVIARRIFGNGAAVPGTSSHGGYWEGRQTLAIDFHNWGSIYGWDQSRWFADCRAVGLTPGMIMRSRGYPDEPWHVIDLDPWGAVPAGTATPLKEWDEMATKQEIKDAIVEVLTTHGAGPGNRGVYDSLKFIASLIDAKGNQVIAEVGTPDVQVFRDAVISALTDWRVFDQNRNVFDQLKFLASSGQVNVPALADQFIAALVPALTPHLGVLTDQTVQQVAVAVADECDRREDGDPEPLPEVESQGPLPVDPNPAEPAGGWPTGGYLATNRLIIDIQKLLGITADGRYGPATSQAVAKWQAARWLTADGIWGVTSDGLGFPPAWWVHGVDYSFARPDIPTMKNRGIRLAGRYLWAPKYTDGRTNKGIDRPEYDTLKANGIMPFFIYEEDGKELRGGFDAGVRVAKAAEGFLGKLGLAGFPVYFNVDYDAPAADMPGILEALKGIASVIGLERTGLYAGFGPVKAAFDAGLIRWGFQTYAWSGGRWDSRAQLQQWSNGQWGGTIDFTRAVAPQFGQNPVT